jgi:hypothetical protein
VHEGNKRLMIFLCAHDGELILKNLGKVKTDAIRNKHLINSDLWIFLAMEKNILHDGIKK